MFNGAKVHMNDGQAFDKHNKEDDANNEEDNDAVINYGNCTDPNGPADNIKDLNFGILFEKLIGKSPYNSKSIGEGKPVDFDLLMLETDLKLPQTVKNLAERYRTLCVDDEWHCRIYELFKWIEYIGDQPRRDPSQEEMVFAEATSKSIVSMR